MKEKLHKLPPPRWRALARRGLPVVFIVVLAVSRIPELLPLNFSVIYAFVFCAGVYFRGGMKWWLPLGVMLATDIALNFYYQHKYPDDDVWSVPNLINLAFNYIAYAVLFLLGRSFQPHTVTLNTQQHMRTKTLLAAAAALVAGLVTSQAQVYSQNIVGYASVTSPNGINTCYSIPFAIGASNGINEIYTSLPLNSKLLIWNPAGSKFNIYFFDDLGSGPGWCNSSDDAYLTSYPRLQAGQGFFLNAGDVTTNTFSGAIAVNVGTTNNTSFSSGINTLVGVPVPYAGSITNGTNLGGGPNLNNLPANSKLLIWNPAGSKFDIYFYDDLGSGLGWCNSSDDAYVTPPSITVGQGYFINAGDVWTWTVGL